MLVHSDEGGIGMQARSGIHIGIRRAVAGGIAAVALASLALQYVLLLALVRDNVGVALGTLRFLSYFTILSNIGVALACLAAAAGRNGFFARDEVRGAVALYIGVTGLIYVAILRHLWQPQGAQWWADSGLHYATPLLYLAWWLAFAPHGALGWRTLPRWLLFPLAYLAWVLLRGAWLGEYPYPFIDLGQLGPGRTSVNALGVLLVFLVLGSVLLWLDRLLARRGP